MSDKIMATVSNRLREARGERGWSQETLARRAGMSRAEVSAIETGRVVPSTALALALAAALDLSVEALFHLGPSDETASGPWAWEPGRVRRFWRAEVGGEVLRYPALETARGQLPQDGPGAGTSLTGWGHDPRRTLVVAGCDPAVGILAELLRPAGVRLLPFVRSSAQALELLRGGRVHAAGLHLGHDALANEAEVRTRLGGGYRLLSVHRWSEGVALAPGTGVRSVAALLRARLSWVGREEGSGARRCFDDLLDGRDPPEGYHRHARDHRGVVEAIRTGWAQAGVCVELAAEEAELEFLPIRREAYDLCYPSALANDLRIRAMVDVVRSRRYRALIGALPGYEAA